MNLSTFTVGPLQENAYLLVDDDSGEAVFVDPGAEGERLVAALAAAGARLTEIWLTHAHFDHVGGVAALQRAWPSAAVRLHPADEPLYSRAGQAAAMYGLTVEEPPPLGAPLADGDVLRVGGYSFSVMHTPGHAPGHVTIHGHGVAFVGDCLFRDSVGRTDLPLSDPQRLSASLLRIAALPDDTRVLAGHGPPTTIARERRDNPFLNGAARVMGG